MNTKQIIELLKKECEKAGSQKAWARANGLSQSYVCDVLQGRRGVGQSIVKALGFKETVSYEKIKP